MTTEKHTLQIDGEGNAEQVLKDTEKAADGVVGKFTELNAVAELFSKTYSATNQIAQQSVGTYLRADAAIGRLSNAIKNAGGGQRELAQTTAFLDSISEKYGITLSNLRDPMRAIIDATGDSTEAQRAFQLALDISAQESIDVAQASEIVRKAYKGEVEELKNLRGISKEYAQDLAKIEDSSIRTETAISALETSYSGAADANAGAIDEVQKFEVAQEALQEALGKTILQLGATTQQVFESTSAFDDGELSVSNIARAFNNFADAVGETGDEIETILTGLDTEKLAQVAAIFGGGFAAGGGTPLGFFTGTAAVIRSDIIAEIADEGETILANERALADEVDETNKKLRERIQINDTKPDAFLDAINLGIGPEDSRRPRSRTNTDTFGGDRADASFDELRDIEEELDLRNQIAQLRLDERDLEAELLIIRESELTDLEKQLETRNLLADAAERQAAALIRAQNEQKSAVAAQESAQKNLSRVQEQIQKRKIADEKKAADLDLRNTRAAIDGAIQVAEISGLGQREVAAIKSAVLLAEAPFLLANPITFAQGAKAVTSGIALAAIAGGVGGSGGSSSSGSSGGAATSTPSRNVREEAQIYAEELANELDARQASQNISITVSTRSVGKLSNEEQRSVAESVIDEMKNQGAIQ